MDGFTAPGWLSGCLSLTVGPFDSGSDRWAVPLPTALLTIRIAPLDAADLPGGGMLACTSILRHSIAGPLPSPRQTAVPLHRLCPGEGDAERNAYIPRGATLFGPRRSGAPHAGGSIKYSSLHLPHQAVLGVGKMGQKVRSGSGFQDPWDPISVIMISSLLFYLVYVATAFQFLQMGVQLIHFQPDLRLYIFF